VQGSADGFKQCAPPDRHHPVRSGSCEGMLPGETCTVSCLDGCAEGGGVLLQCPDGNRDNRTIPTILRGFCRSTCEACILLNTTDKDKDKRKDVLTTGLTFGSAHVDGYLDEDPILEYAVYFADRCGSKIGDALEVVRKGVDLHSCCRPNAYAVRIEEQPVPPGATKLTVVVRTNQGELPYGPALEFVDWAEAPPRIASARRTAAPSSFLALLEVGLLVGCVSLVHEGWKPF